MIYNFPTDFILKLHNKILSQIERIKQIILMNLICKISLIFWKLNFKILFIENHAEFVHVFSRGIVIDFSIMIF